MLLPVKPVKFTDLDTNFGTTVAKALWYQAAQMLEYVNQSYPIGMLMFFEASQSNLPAQPDSRFWKFMDGTAVSNANSPLNGVTLPDLRGRFLRHPKTGEVALVNAGSDTRDLSHSHTGFTGYADNAGSQNTDDDSADQPAAGLHRHTIGTASLVVTIIPLSYELQVYMRVL